MTRAGDSFLQFLKNMVQNHPGGTYSFLFHLTIFVVLLAELPDFSQKEIAVVRPISVELLPIDSITNVKPMDSKLQPKAEEKKEEKKKPLPPTSEMKPHTIPEPVKKPEVKAEPEKKEIVEPKKPEPIPTPKPVAKPEIKVKEKPKETATPKPKPEEKKAEPKKEIKKEEVKKERDFTSVLRSLEQLEKTESKPSAPAQAYNPNLPLSMTEIDAIIHQLSQCWTISAGARDAENLAVVLRLSLMPDGTVREVSIVDSSRYSDSSETFFRASADSAVRAVKLCSPLKNLPMNKYENWKELELNFDPSEMIY